MKGNEIIDYFMAEWKLIQNHKTINAEYWSS